MPFWLLCIFACMHSSQYLTQFKLKQLLYHYCFYSFYSALIFHFAWLIDHRHWHLVYCNCTHVELKMNAGRLPSHLWKKQHIFNSGKSCGLSMLLSVKTTNDRRDEVVLFRRVIAGPITLSTDTAEVVYFRPSGSSCGYQRCHVWLEVGTWHTCPQYCNTAILHLCTFSVPVETHESRTLKPSMLFLISFLFSDDNDLSAT